MLTICQSQIQRFLKLQKKVYISITSLQNQPYWPIVVDARKRLYSQVVFMLLHFTVSMRVKTAVLMIITMRSQPHSYGCCQNPYSTTTELNLCWIRHENDFSYPTPPPPTQTQCQQHLSCYCPDFDETLNAGSWKHLEPIPTVAVTFVEVTFVLATFVHIMNISTVTDPILMKL